MEGIGNLVQSLLQLCFKHGGEHPYLEAKFGGITLFCIKERYKMYRSYFHLCAFIQFSPFALNYVWQSQKFSEENVRVPRVTLRR